MRLDLHTHTKYSDGTDTFKQILIRAQREGLEYLSITDHNCVDAYFELDDYREYFFGKLITGIEPECCFEGQLIELLGYGFDAKKLKGLIKGVYLSNDEVLQKEFERFYLGCVRAGIKFSDDVLHTWDKTKHHYPAYHLHEDMKKYPQNKRIICDDESWNSGTQFFRIYSAKKSTPFYIDMSDCYPSARAVYDLIKAANGKVFIPHIFLYENARQLLEKLVLEFKIDGIECFYPSFSGAQTDYLLDFAAKNNLLVSLGSDYHGLARSTALGMSVLDFSLVDWLKQL